MVALALMGGIRAPLYGMARTPGPISTRVAASRGAAHAAAAADALNLLPPGASVRGMRDWRRDGCVAG